MRSLPHPRVATALWAMVLALAVMLVTPPRPAHAADTLLSQGKPATASSTENAGTAGRQRRRRQHRHPLVQRRSATRSGSRSTSAPPRTICQVVLHWEAAYAHGLPDPGLRPTAPRWTTIYSTTTGTGGTADPDRHRHRPLRADVRHRPGHRVRLLAVGVPGVRHRRRHDHRRADPGGGDLGPNVERLRPVDVRRHDPEPARTRLQPAGDQPVRHRSATRCCSSRAPTTLNANIGFYTSVAGLGLNPDDVNINGDVTRRRRLVRRQRHAELLALGGEPVGQPAGGTNRWAVSQAAPFRRMHVHGGLNLAPDRLRLGQRRLHRRHQDRRHGRLRTRSSSGTPATARSAAGQRRLEHGLLGRAAARPRRASRTRRTPRSTTTPVDPGEAVPVRRRRRQLPGVRARRCAPTPPAPAGPAAPPPGTVAPARASSTSPSPAPPPPTINAALAAGPEPAVHARASTTSTRRST